MAILSIKYYQNFLKIILWNIIRPHSIQIITLSHQYYVFVGANLKIQFASDDPVET